MHPRQEEEAIQFGIPVSMRAPTLPRLPRLVSVWFPITDTP